MNWGFGSDFGSDFANGFEFNDNDLIDKQSNRFKLHDRVEYMKQIAEDAEFEEVEVSE